MFRALLLDQSTDGVTADVVELDDDRDLAFFEGESFGLLLLLRFAMRALLAHRVPSAAMAQALLRSRGC